MSHENTKRIRAALDAEGIAYDKGYRIGAGEPVHRVNEEDVTVLLPPDGDVRRSVSVFEDKEGKLWVDDEISARAVVALARALARGEA